MILVVVSMTNVGRVGCCAMYTHSFMIVTVNESYDVLYFKINLWTFNIYVMVSC